nr:hypothetical protein [uncultured Halomonas sp.]
MTNAIRNIADDATRAFAEACYDTNDLKELDSSVPDEVDMKQWGITAEQWSEAVAAARTDLKADSEAE